MTQAECMSDKEPLPFEEALRKLESIVQKLEQPDVSLEESVRLYEEGMKLSRECSEKLDDAVLKIEEINKQNSDQIQQKPGD
jgi:exodeoxyribonuclease VII small subunit